MQRKYTSMVHTAVILFTVSFSGSVSAEEPAKLACHVGPIERDFGGSSWVVYSCSDGDSIVVVSAAGNPAMPFVFIIGREDGVRTLHGEGKGAKEASSAAFEELRALIDSETELQEIIRQTKSVDGS